MTAALAAGPAVAAPLRAVDRLTVEEQGDSLALTAVKYVDADEPFLRGHFPGRPVYPGVFVVETLRQAVVAAIGTHDGKPPTISNLRSLRFRAPLLPGDELRIAATLPVPGPGDAFRVKAACTRAGEVVATLTVDFGEAPAAAPRRDEHAAGATVPAGGTGGVLDLADIQALLPYRHPALLVDRVVALDPGRTIEAVKAVTASEPCYADLPDGLPADRYAYPTSLLVESFGQAAALMCLAGREALGLGEDHLILFGAGRDCRIEAPVLPGDVLRHRVRLDQFVAGTAFATGDTWVGDTRVASFGSVVAALRPRSSLPTA